MSVGLVSGSNNQAVTYSQVSATANEPTTTTAVTQPQSGTLQDDVVTLSQDGLATLDNGGGNEPDAVDDGGEEVITPMNGGGNEPASAPPNGGGNEPPAAK